MMNMWSCKFGEAGRLTLLLVGTIGYALTSSLIAQTQQLDVAGAVAGGQATATSSALDIGNLNNIFDGNSNTLARTANINPMVVTVSFTTPQQLARSRIYFLGGDSK